MLLAPGIPAAHGGFEVFDFHLARRAAEAPDELLFLLDAVQALVTGHQVLFHHFPGHAGEAIEKEVLQLPLRQADLC
jgi:hypothetical protein